MEMAYLEWDGWECLCRLQQHRVGWTDGTLNVHTGVEEHMGQRRKRHHPSSGTEGGDEGENGY